MTPTGSSRERKPMSFRTVTLCFSSQPSMGARSEPPGAAGLPSLLSVGSPCSRYSPVGPHCHRLAALLGRDGSQYRCQVFPGSPLTGQFFSATSGILPAEHCTKPPSLLLLIAWIPAREPGLRTETSAMGAQHEAIFPRRLPRPSLPSRLR